MPKRIKPLSEVKVRTDLIEHQLAHAVRDPLGRAYNRTQHLPERKKMMQQWAVSNAEQATSRNLGKNTAILS